MIAVLAGLTVVYAGLALLRMRSLTRNRRFEMAGSREQLEIVEPPRGIGGAFRAEWRRVLGARSAFSLLFLAPLVYGKGRSGDLLSPSLQLAADNK